MMHLVVIDADEDDAVVAQELAREEEAGVHHRQPVRMVAPAGLGVAGEDVALGVDLARLLQVGLERLAVVVLVDEVVAGVVGRVDVDHLDLAHIGLVEELEHLQVLALDEEVLGGLPVD